MTRGDLASAESPRRRACCKADNDSRGCRDCADRHPDHFYKKASAVKNLNRRPRERTCEHCQGRKSGGEQKDGWSSSGEPIPSHFIRIHRSAIVRLDHVAEIRTDTADRQFVVLRDGARLPLGRSRRAVLEEALGKR